LILIVKVLRTALDCVVNYNKCVNEFTTGRACTLSSDIKDGKADIQLRCELARN